MECCPKHEARKLRDDPKRRLGWKCFVDRNAYGASQQAADGEFRERLSVVLRRFESDTTGATAIEYAMIAAMTCLCAIGAYTQFVPDWSDLMNRIAVKLVPA